MFYAVAKGINPGVYISWSECKKQVKNYRGSRFKKFKNRDDAENFVSGQKISVGKVQSKINDFFKVSGVKKPLKKPDSEPDYYVYTDGACSNNGTKYAKAGMGVYFGKNDPRNVSRIVNGRQTNNVAELSAIIETYSIIDKDIKSNKKICIATDSKYCITCATTYGTRMNRDNWKNNIPNKELVKTLYKLYNGNITNVKLQHVKAHTSNTDIHSVGNFHADRLATEAII